MKVQTYFLLKKKVRKENFKYYAPLAQLVEQLTLNQWVLGSSPRWCTIKSFSLFFVQHRGRERPLKNMPVACFSGREIGSPAERYRNVDFAHQSREEDCQRPDVARWSSGQDGGLSRRKREFDSPTGHHLSLDKLMPIWYHEQARKVKKARASYGA